MTRLHFLTLLIISISLAACHRPPPVVEPAVIETVPVEVLVSGVRNDTGDILLSVFTAAEGFPCESQYAYALAAQPAKAGEMLFNVDLPVNRQVAIAILHDENRDKALDLIMGLIPVEGFAVSNNTKGMGSQDFDNAIVTPQPGMQLQLEMQYYK